VRGGEDGLLREAPAADDVARGEELLRNLQPTLRLRAALIGASRRRRSRGWCRGGVGGEADGVVPWWSGWRGRGRRGLQAVGMGKAPEPPRTRLLRRLLQNAATAATLVGAATVLWGFTHPQGTDTTVAGDDLRS
jgi:hypothetical protein